LASALGLNEVGLCALALNKYPLPNLEDLPFRLWPLRMPHGIGVVNAYVVACRDEERGLLFDTGPGPGAPETGWPAEILGIDAVFITHIEAEHAGGLQGAISHFGLKAAYIPAGSKSPLGIPLGEAEKIAVCGLEVTAFRTPGHCALHNCYHVSLAGSPSARSLLISGDLVFAGSAGGPFYCKRQLREHLGRVLATVPGDTAVAPGHGPMTTAANELRYNPFVF
jgi:glyoxylase-like metal-dependent hydrolase (beta-lactamase superfamily II)